MRDKLRLSIVLPKLDLSQHSLDLIKWCSTNDRIEIVCLICEPDQQISLINFIEKKIWDGMLCVERAKLNIRKINQMEALRQIGIGSNPKAYDLIHDDPVIMKELHKLGIDMHLCLKTESFVTTLKDSAKYGALSFAGANESSEILNPYFFSEVLYKRDSTQFKILHHQPNSKKVYVVQKGELPTHGYFLANRENILLRQNFYMQIQIEAVIEKRIVSEAIFDGPIIDSRKLAPSLFDQFKYLLQLLHLACKRFFSLFKGDDLWNVGIYKGNWRSLDFNKAMIINNPKNHFLADPFVINKDNKDYCFVEDFDLKKAKGVISAYEIGDKNITNAGLALEENFHLSFPYLFECDSKTYMLPETTENNDIRIYESIHFPLEWKLCKVIKENVSAVDSMIFKHENRWWLFTNINPIGERDTCSELSLFYSNHPISGTWIPHTKNPVVFTPSRARNGGIIIEEDCIYRIGQKQAFGTYGGGGFSVNKIIALSPDVYEEETTSLVEPSFFQGNKGAHHFHTNGNISTFDFLT
jgi:hypothetical protein